MPEAPTKTEIAIFGLILGFTFSIGQELADMAWTAAARAILLLLV